ncbi:uncharacterized protein LOC125320887 [Corvus hawaiiensis]|uniref:uncharacterized protein LOC125320887 n=1 Tax=Corvus hawaiiensis TaxID=134902 RepID=UPI002019B353|nr:uncharacterized protein LOC125320887 [Corvus hawaiiensis]
MQWKPTVRAARSPPWRRSRWRTAPGAAKPKRRRDPPEKKERREKGRSEEEKQAELGRGGAGRGESSRGSAGSAAAVSAAAPGASRSFPPFSLPFSPLSHPTGTWRTRHHGPERCPTVPPAPPRAGGHGSCSRRVADAVEADGSCRHVHPHGEGLGGEQHLGQVWGRFGAVWVRIGLVFWAALGQFRAVLGEVWGRLLGQV